jgi:hypothetical protein
VILLIREVAEPLLSMTSAGGWYAMLDVATEMMSCASITSGKQSNLSKFTVNSNGRERTTDVTSMSRETEERIGG